MPVEKKLRYLRFALGLIGAFFVVGLYPMMHYWPTAWGWNPSQPEYEQMIQGVYATLGVFLILAMRNPMEHRSLIWFTVWSSIVHGGIMLVQALVDSSEHHNMYGDIPGLFLVAFILAILMPKKSEV